MTQSVVKLGHRFFPYQGVLSMQNDTYNRIAALLTEPVAIGNADPAYASLDLRTYLKFQFETGLRWHTGGWKLDPECLALGDEPTHVKLVDVYLTWIAALSATPDDHLAAWVDSYTWTFGAAYRDCQHVAAIGKEAFHQELMGYLATVWNNRSWK